MRGILPAIAGISLIGMVGCGDTCNENKNALPLAGFYDSSTGKEIIIDSLEVYGIGIAGDSLLSSARTTKNELYLPFRITSDTTQYVFRSINGGYSISDTVTFVYLRTPRFVNVECGVSYVFDICDINYTGAIIDSVTCPTGFIDNSNKENLHIYFSTTSTD